METAVVGRMPLSPNYVFNSKSGEKSCLSKGPCNYQGMIFSVTTAGSGRTGVLDKPVKEKSAPGRESEFDLRKSRKMAPPYRVILHNDNFNRRDYVVKVLMKVIPGMTLDIAFSVMQEADLNGLAVVIVCSQADAEEHCTKLRNNGLLSSIEPETGGC